MAARKKRKPRPEPPPLPARCVLVDSHCHLDMADYAADLDTVVQAAAEAGIGAIVTIGIDLASSRAALDLARRFPQVHATVGVHPHEAGTAGARTLAALEAMARDAPALVCGYGEIGLDFAKEYAPRPVQRQAFSDQLHLAKSLGLPVVIHDRDAHEETLALLREQAPYPSGGVYHCFSGDLELARKVIELGFFLSIPGIVTFAKAESLQQVVRQVPLDHLLLETDGPFLAPTPWRGKRNEPRFLLYTAQAVARIKGVELEAVAEATSANAAALFGITPLRRSP